MKTEHHSDLMLRHRARAMRHRWMEVIGLVLLLAGYGLLAVDPDTASQWVLLRVVAGFGLLFVGFGVAIVPTLSRMTGSEGE